MGDSLYDHREEALTSSFRVQALGRPQHPRCFFTESTINSFINSRRCRTHSRHCCSEPGRNSNEGPQPCGNTQPESNREASAVDTPTYYRKCCSDRNPPCYRVPALGV